MEMLIVKSISFVLHHLCGYLSQNLISYSSGPMQLM